MIAKYILIIVMYRDGYGNKDIITQEFYSLKQCRQSASFLAQDKYGVKIAYCTEK